MLSRDPRDEYRPQISAKEDVEILRLPKPMISFLDLRAAYLELKADIDSVVARVLDSGRYVLGDEVDSFEADYAEYCGAQHCVGVANGLDALVLEDFLIDRAMLPDTWEPLLAAWQGRRRSAFSQRKSAIEENLYTFV